MIRYVHQQSLFAAIVTAWGALALTVSWAVWGSPFLRPGTLVQLLIVLAASVLAGYYYAYWSKLSGARMFRDAVPVADPEAVLTDVAHGWWDELRRCRGMMAVCAVSVPVAVPLDFVGPGLLYGSLLCGVERVMRAEQAARWERRRGVLLWLSDEPEDDQPASLPDVFTTPRRPAPLP